MYTINMLFIHINILQDFRKQSILKKEFSFIKLNIEEKLYVCYVDYALRYHTIPKPVATCIVYECDVLGFSRCFFTLTCLLLASYVPAVMLSVCRNRKGRMRAGYSCYHSRRIFANRMSHCWGFYKDKCGWLCVSGLYRCMTPCLLVNTVYLKYVCIKLNCVLSTRLYTM